MKKTAVISSIISALVIISICVSSEIGINKEEQGDKYRTHFALTHTKRVGGLMPYNVKSDLIIDISEEYLLSINDSCITYDELVSEIGEPSGTVGSGIIRDYWRIGENKYAVCLTFGDKPYFEIWNNK